MARISHRLLGDLLIERGHIDAAARDKLLARQRSEPRRLGELAIEDAGVSEEALRDALTAQHGIEAADPDADAPTEDATGVLPHELISRWEAIPLAVEGDRLVVGFVNPDDALAVESVSRASGYADLDPRVITAAAFTRYAASLGLQPALRDAISRGATTPVTVAAEAGEAAGSPDADAESPPVTGLLNHVLTQALALGASDVHIEPSTGATRIRLRVDGSLLTLVTAPRRLHAALVARLESLAGSSSGTIHVSSDDNAAGFRLGVLGTADGPKATLRRTDARRRSLGEIDLPEMAVTRLRQALTVAQGLVQVTGPRGNGRTATAMALADAVDASARQVTVVTGSAGATVPPGAITLVASRDTPAAALVEEAAAQDADVIVVDCADDTESRLAAARAALDGHLVIAVTSSLRATHAIVDWVASGVPAWQAAAALRAVISQRLCRRIDPASAVDYTPTANELLEFGIPEGSDSKGTFKQPGPTAENHGTGYSGRIGIYEVLLPSSALRTAIRDGATPSALLEQARTTGFNTLWEDAVLKVVRGDTTFEEVRAALIPPG